MQQFSHGGADDLHGRLAVFLQAAGEPSDNLVVLRRHDRRKVECFKDSAVALFGQVRAFLAGAGFLLARRDACLGSHLAGVFIASEIHFAQQQLCRLFANAGDGQQEVVLGFELRMLIQMLVDFLLQLGDFLGECRDDAVEAVVGFQWSGFTTILFHLQHLREGFNSACQSL